ncbi:MAG: hypothetical protein KJ568_02610 [Actinobacteria bacterium]|nr:hypothetical protein [Actinomycetota bacterium]
MLKINDIMNLINELEEKFPVDRWVIDSVHVWPLVRFHLFINFIDSHFCGKKTILPPPLGTSSTAGTIISLDFAKIVFRILRSIWRFGCAQVMDSQKSQRADRRFDVLLLNYNTYMTKMNGSWYSRLCDPFVGHLSERGMSCLMLTAGYEYPIPRFTRSIFIQPYLIIYRIMGMLNRDSKYERLEQLIELENHVRGSGLFPKSFSLIKPVRRRIKQITAIEKYFKRFLMKTKPRAVFVTCYYSTESMALILACHHLGIPSIDIQHGSQGNVHVAYGRWNRLPEKGYELLPTIFWCWSEFETSAIKRWSKCNASVHQPVVGGNLFLQRWVTGEDDIVRAYDKIMSDLKRDSKDKIHILYSLNGCTESDLGAMVEIIKGVNNSGLRSYFWVRLHPVTIDQIPEVKRILNENGINNFELDNATRLPLYAILRHMDIHITEWSSVVIEAEYFNVPSIMVHELGIETFPDQFSSGWAISAYTINEIISGIQLQLERRLLLKEKRRNSAVPIGEAFDYLFDLVSQSTRR